MHSITDLNTPRKMTQHHVRVLHSLKKNPNGRKTTSGPRMLGRAEYMYQSCGWTPNSAAPDVKKLNLKNSHHVITTLSYMKISRKVPAARVTQLVNHKSKTNIDHTAQNRTDKKVANQLS